MKKPMKPALLFLSHRIPFPPNKGDKIRSYQLLKYLSEHYRVYLGTFIDDPEDWQYQAQVRAFCEECCFVRLNQRNAKIKSLTGLMSGVALTLPYFFSKELACWVNEQLNRHNIQRAVIYSSAMAQYISGEAWHGERKIIDFVDIDSDKWRQYSTKKTFPLSWIYRREAKKLLAYEKIVAEEFDASLFVSLAEADLFKSLSPEIAGKVGFYNNGVDTSYFSPDIQLATPYDAHEKPLVFTGAMDYWPNVEAVSWFAKEVFPILRMSNNKLRFYIVGSNPVETVSQLAKIPGVIVTGRVPDVRPYLKYAKAAVVPIRVARGIQNKVLEAMAMAKTVIVSPQALEGIDAEHRKHVLLCDDKSAWVNQIQLVLEENSEEMGRLARHKVMIDFSWEDNLPTVKRWLESGHCPGGPSVHNG